MLVAVADMDIPPVVEIEFNPEALLATIHHPPLQGHAYEPCHSKATANDPHSLVFRRVRVAAKWSCHYCRMSICGKSADP